MCVDKTYFEGALMVLHKYAFLTVFRQFVSVLLVVFGEATISIVLVILFKNVFNSPYILQCFGKH